MVRLQNLYLQQFGVNSPLRNICPLGHERLTLDDEVYCLLDNGHLWMSLEKEKLQECHFSSAGVTAWSQMLAAGCGSTK